MRETFATLWVGVALLGGCGRATPSKELTTGVKLTPPGCGYSITTPAETTAPSDDDGFQSPTPGARSLHLGWVGNPSTTMVVTWVTDFETTATMVELDGRKVHGFSFAYPTDLNAAEPPTVRVHQVHLCGLQPATTYHYTASGMSGQFATAPAGPAPTKILVAGDSRGNAATWGQVFGAGAAEQPDFALFTGDANDLGVIQEDWDAWFAAMAPHTAELPMLAAEGNHEVDARHYYAQLPLPGNQKWYDFDYGDVHVVVLYDSTDATTISGEEAQFLEQSLSTTQKTWKLVSHHKPPYTSSTAHGPAVDLQQSWSPIYDRYGVDLVLNGHNHVYERSRPINAGQVVGDGQGPVYVVEGGGGADPYGVSPNGQTAFATVTFGYVTLSISGRMLQLQAKSLDGSVIDQYAISK